MSDLFPDDPVALSARREATYRGAQEAYDLSQTQGGPSLFGLDMPSQLARGVGYEAPYRLAEFGSTVAYRAFDLVNQGVHAVTGWNPDQDGDNLMRGAEERMSRVLRERRLSMAPDPQRSSVAGQILYGLGGIGGMAAAGGPIAGLGPLLTGGGYGVSTAHEMLDEGVDERTAWTAGGIEGVSMAALVAAPVALPSAARSIWTRIAQRAGTGAAINAGTGAAYRYSMESYLRSEGYEEQADRYRWNDAQAFATDVILGAVMGGAFGRRGTLREMMGVEPRDREEGEPPQLTGEDHLDRATEAYEAGDMAVARAHALMADRLGEQEGAFLAEQWAREHGEEVAQDSDVLAAIMAVDAGLKRPTSAQVRAAMDSQGEMRSAIDNAPGIPLDLDAQARHAQSFSRAEQQFANGEDVDVGGIWAEPLEGAGFAPHLDPAAQAREKYLRYQREIEARVSELDSLLANHIEDAHERAALEAEQRALLGRREQLAREAMEARAEVIAEAAVRDVLEEEGFAELAREVEQARSDVRRLGGEIGPDDAMFSMGRARGLRGLDTQRGTARFYDPRLSDVQNKVVEMARNNYSNAEIAEEMDFDRNNHVATHLANVRRAFPDIEIPASRPGNRPGFDAVAGETTATIEDIVRLRNRLIGQGFTNFRGVGRLGQRSLNQTIAARLHISPGSVKVRLSRYERAVREGRREPLFSQGQDGAATPDALRARAEQEIADLTGATWADLERAAFVAITPSHDALAQALRADGRDATANRILIDRPAAVHLPWSKKTHFIADHIAVEDMRGLILHEIGVHHGMADMLGPRGFKELLRQVDRMAADGHPVLAPIREAVDEYVAEGRMVPDDAREETLAYLIETQADLPLVNSLLSRVRQWLIKTFGQTFGMRLTVDDLRALAITSLRRAAEQARRDGAPDGVAEVSVDPRYSASDGLAPESLSLARYWIDSFGGGPTAEARAIEVMRGQLQTTGHPAMRQRLEDAIASVGTRDYVRGERNMFSQAVEAAWPEIYAPRVPDAGSVGGGQFVEPDAAARRVFHDLSYYNRYVVEEVPIDGLRLRHAPNADFEASAARYPESVGSDSHLPAVARINGELVVMDGTHRVAAAAARGDKMRVRVFDVDGASAGRAPSVPDGGNSVATPAPGTQRLFHGSTNNFDEFDARKVGSGQGDNARGWGVSLTDGRAAAERYAGRMGRQAGPGVLYEVDVPAGPFIDDSLPLSAQPPEVQALARQLGFRYTEDLTSELQRPARFASQRAASEAFRAAGVRGLRHRLRKDSDVRGVLIFDPADATIVTRDGQPLGRQAAARGNADGGASVFRPNLGANDRGMSSRAGALFRGDEFIDSAAGQGTMRPPQSVQEALEVSSNPLPTRAAGVANSFARSLQQYMQRGDWEGYSRTVDIAAEAGPLALVRTARALAEADPRYASRAADFASVNDLASAQDFLEFVRRANDPYFARQAQIAQDMARRNPSTPQLPNAGSDDFPLFSMGVRGQNRPDLLGARRDPIESPDYQQRLRALREGDGEQGRAGEAEGSRAGGVRRVAGEPAGSGAGELDAAAIRETLAVSGIELTSKTGRDANGMGEYRAQIDTPFASEADGVLRATALTEGRGTLIDFDLIDGSNPKETRLPGVHVRLSAVHEAARGQRVGIWLYRQLIEWADRQGLPVYSDALSVSPSAQRIYDRLQQRGYAVERMGRPKRSSDGSLLSTDGTPVYRVSIRDAIDEALEAAPLPRGDYEIDGPTLRERQERIDQAKARADEYAALSPAEQVLRDEPEMKFSMGRAMRERMRQRVEDGRNAVTPRLSDGTFASRMGEFGLLEGSARDLMDTAARQEAEAREMRKGYEAAARCAARHGGSMAGRQAATVMAGQALGAAAAVPTGLALAPMIARDARRYSPEQRREAELTEGADIASRRAVDAMDRAREYSGSLGTNDERFPPVEGLPENPAERTPVDVDMGPPPESDGYAPGQYENGMKVPPAPAGFGGTEVKDDAQDLIDLFEPIIGAGLAEGDE